MWAALRRDYFTAAGRIGRLQYWKLTLKSSLISAATFIVAIFAARSARVAFLLLATLSLGFIIVASATIVMRRFHDHGRNGLLGSGLNCTSRLRRRRGWRR